MSRPKRAAAGNPKFSYKENKDAVEDAEDSDFKLPSKPKKRRTVPQVPLKSMANDTVDGKPESKPKEAKRRHTIASTEVKDGGLTLSVKPETMTAIESKTLDEGLTIAETAGCPIVYFDLETTGIGRDCEITQIGAANGTKKYSRYLFPERGIAPFVQKLTGITVIGRQMYYKKKEVESLSAKDGVLEFFDWLKKMGAPVILVAHNAKGFDSRVLLQVAHEQKLVDELRKIIIGFSDTLLLFRSRFPRAPNHKLKTLVQLHCSDKFAWHNAMADVNAMMKLCEKTNVARADFIAHSFSTDFMCRVFEFTPLIDDGCFQKEIARKIVANQLSVADLKEAARQGFESLELSLKSITSYAPMIQRIHGFFYTENWEEEEFNVDDELEKSLTQIETDAKSVKVEISTSDGNTVIATSVELESSVVKGKVGSIESSTVKVSAKAVEVKVPVSKAKASAKKAAPAKAVVQQLPAKSKVIRKAAAATSAAPVKVSDTVQAKQVAKGAAQQAITPVPVPVIVVIPPPKATPKNSKPTAKAPATGPRVYTKKSATAPKITVQPLDASSDSRMNPYVHLSSVAAVTGQVL